eukprot:4979855-Prorocentrum_lima.AAC.1
MALPQGAVAKDIEAAEDSFIKEWGDGQGWLEQLACLNTHWQLRDRLKQDLMSDQTKPKPKELYIWWDFQEPHRLHHKTH